PSGSQPRDGGARRFQAGLAFGARLADLSRQGGERPPLIFYPTRQGGLLVLAAFDEDAAPFGERRPAFLQPRLQVRRLALHGSEREGRPRQPLAPFHGLGQRLLGRRLEVSHGFPSIRSRARA